MNQLNTKPSNASPCSAWLSEERIIQCEWISDDGLQYSCAHCGRKPTPKMSVEEFKQKLIELVANFNSSVEKYKPVHDEIVEAYRSLAKHKDDAVLILLDQAVTDGVITPEDKVGLLERNRNYYIGDKKAEDLKALGIRLTRESVNFNIINPPKRSMGMFNEDDDGSIQCHRIFLWGNKGTIDLPIPIFWAEIPNQLIIKKDT